MDVCQPNEPDDNVVRQMKSATSETASDAIEKAQRLTDPELVRRQTIIDVFQAQAHIDDSEYEQATKIALIALEKSGQIRSRLNKDRIAGLYSQLLNTSFKDEPLLARLGVQLHTWH